jgi:hypothetical protein
LKRCSFAASVNDPIDDNENVASEHIFLGDPFGSVPRAVADSIGFSRMPVEGR